MSIWTSVKKNWKNRSEGAPTTPLNAAALDDLEARIEAAFEAATAAVVVDAGDPQYGLEADTGTDQHAEFQAAVDDARTAVSLGSGSAVVQLFKEGEYTLALHDIPGQTPSVPDQRMCAGLWLDTNIHLQLGPGVVLKLVDAANWDTDCYSGALVTVYGGRTRSTVAENWSISGGIIDGNASAQVARSDPNNAFDGAVHRGIFVCKSRNAVIRNVVGRNFYGGGSSPPDESFVFSDYVSENTLYFHCAVQGTQSTGFASELGSAGTKRIACVAFDCVNGYGFVSHKVTNVIDAQCEAYGCGAAGFNYEICEKVSIDVLAGGRGAYTGSLAYAPLTPLEKRPNNIGIQIAGSRLTVVSEDSRATYNTTYGVRVQRWTAGSPTLHMATEVDVRGVHLHNGTADTHNISVESAAETSATITGDITSGTDTITSVSGTCYQGQDIYHASLPPGTTITDVTGTTVTVSADATATSAGASISVYSRIRQDAVSTTAATGSASIVRRIKAAAQIILYDGSTSGTRFWEQNSSSNTYAFRWGRLAAGPVIGASTSTPDLAINSNGQVETGARVRRVREITGNASILLSDDILPVTATATLSLPDSTSVGVNLKEGFEIEVHDCGAGGGNVTVQRAGSSDTFQGGGTSKTIATTGHGLRIRWEQDVWRAEAITLA